MKEKGSDPVNERISEVKTSFGLPAAYTNLTLTDPYYAFDKEHRVQEGMNYFQQEKEDGTQALL